jgi:hypothetical protein
MKLRTGDRVEIKSKEEILRTLDKKGQLEGMPFMPQMFQFCGQRFKIYKRAHKSCDTVNPIRGISVPDAVHLDLRCDGEAYGGCQAACLLFWKTAWLKPVNETGRTAERVLETGRLDKDSATNTASCTEADVWAARYAEEGQGTVDGPRYRCQATQLPSFSTYLPWWDFRQYIEDYTSGNETFGQLLRGLIYASYASAVQAGIGLGPFLRWLYDTFQSMWGGLPYPRKSGTIPIGQSTPMSILDLQQGELVRVKSHKEILVTLDKNSRNRGLMFDGEMMPYCGGTYRVRTRLYKFIDEKTGKMTIMKNPVIILDGVWCRARYSWCRMFCPRSIYPWWRETWLERVPETKRSLAETGTAIMPSSQRGHEGCAQSQASERGPVPTCLRN